jgi:predicted nucleic acid-binding protein
MSPTAHSALYVDTNLLVFAHAHATRGSGSPDHPVFDKGKGFEESLGLCRDNHIRVLTSWWTFLELQHGHVKRGKLRYWLIDLGLPPAIAFGSARHRGVLKEAAPAADAMERLRGEIDGWLASWPFKDIVEFESPDAGLWFEMARTVTRFEDLDPADCLHLAAALTLECDYFLTDDNRLRSALESLKQNDHFVSEIGQVGVSVIPAPKDARTFPRREAP